MSLTSRAKRYLRVYGLRAVPIQVIRYVRRRLFSRQGPVLARRQALGIELHQRLDGVVQGGALKGFRMANDLTWGAGDRGAMLTGLYEVNVADLLKEFAKDASVLIDIGAADGYFGVGAVAAGLYSRSICFERDPITRQALLEVARLNDVSDRVTVYGEAGPSFINSIEQQGVNLSDAVVLCDIEGGEFELLNDEVLSALRECKLIIELHDEALEDGEIRRLRLAATAEKYFGIRFLDGGPRDPGSLHLLRDLPDDDRWLICSEGRTIRQQWMVLEPIRRG